MAEQETGWDRFVAAIAWRLLGNRQAMERAGLAGPNPLSGQEVDIKKLVKDAKPPEGWEGMAGEMLMLAPTMAIPGGPFVQGAASGAVAGVTEPNTTDADRLTQGAIGAGVGGVAGVFGGLIAEFGKRGLSTFNKKVLEAAAPPGVKINKTGHEGIRQLQDAWDAAWGSVAPKLRAPIDEKLVTDLQGIHRGMAAEGYTAEESTRFWSIIEGQILGHGDELVGEGAQRVQSRLGKLSTTRKDISDPLMQARVALLDAIERGSPEAAGELAQLRKSYPAFLAVEGATAKATADSGQFTPGQLSVASRAVDRSAHKASSAAGEAPLQGLATEGFEAGAGQRTTLGTLTRGTPLAQGAMDLAEKSPAVQQVGEAVGAVRPALPGPAAGAFTTGQNPQQPGAIDMPTYKPTFDGFGEVDQMLQPYMNTAPAPAPEGYDFIDKLIEESIGGTGLQGNAGGRVDRMMAAFEAQESGGRNVTSVDGARGPMQIMPATFRRYAKPGESIDNPTHNRTVGRRYIEDLAGKYSDDRQVFAAYFSGKPDFTSTKTDGNGKSVSSYVREMQGRMGA